MKLTQILPLYEAIHISSSDIQKISNTLASFKSYVNDYIDEFDENYTDFETIFTKRLQEVITEIISKYYHEDKKYILYVDVDPNSNHLAHVWARWKYTYNMWHNRLTLRLSNEELKNIDIPKISSTISHEITHLIQTLKAAQHDSKGSKIYNKTDKYLTDTLEIEAYAQSVASDIMNKIYSKRRNYDVGIINDIKKYIDVIKSSYAEYRHLDVLSYYTMYKQKYGAVDDDKSYKVWKLFNKKLIQKLQQYIGDYSHPRNSARYDVYQNGELIDSVWYGINDDVENIRRGLIDHDGYPEDIVVKRTKRKTV